MRRNVLARNVRGLIERLENRLLLSSTLSLGAGSGGIFGIAYNDVNGNGFFDAGDVVVPGATVTLQQVGVTYAPGTIPTVQADANGGFSFTSLATGQYDLNIVPQAGFVQDAPAATFAITVSANDIAQVDLGETNNASGGGSGLTNITGTVFNDPTQSGIYTPGVSEPLAGDTVYLDLNGNGIFDAGEFSTTTNNVGVYTFQVPSTDIFGNPILVDSIPAAGYEVRVVPRPGFHQDFPGYVQAAAYSDQTVVANIGESNLANISGVVFDDLNGNGIQDAGEPGVSGETVFIDSNLNGVFDDGTTFDPVTGLPIPIEPHTMTDVNGLYSFAGLTPGTYRIIVQSNSGRAEDTPGYDDVTVSAGQQVTLNIGEGLPTTISGTVFNDRNANGVLDAGENGIPGQTVYLDVNDNGAFDIAGTGSDGLPLAFPEPSAVTDANGNYTIPDVGPGTYTLRAVTPAGAIPTGPPNVSHSYTITVLPNQTLLNENFGSESPDLAVKFIKFPTTAGLTDVVRHAVVRITNVGNLPFNGSVEVNLYAQTTNAPLDTTTATLVSTTNTAAFHMGIGQSRLFKFAFTYPIQLPSNAYYISAQIIPSEADNDSANNVTAPIGPVQVILPFIDIGLAYATLPPFTVDPGQPVPIELTVINHGNVPTKGDLDFRIYLSQNAAIEPTDIVLQDTILPHVRLRPGDAALVKITIPYPGPNLGFKYINAIVSTDDPLGDANQTNNTAIEAQSTRFD